MHTDIDVRLEHSVRLLKGWDWMSVISTHPDQAISVLSDEARSLVKLGPANPGRAREIGMLIVNYQRLISSLKDGAVMSK